MEEHHDQTVATQLARHPEQLIAAVSYIEGEPPKPLEIDEIGKVMLNPKALFG